MYVIVYLKVQVPITWNGSHKCSVLTNVALNKK